MKKSLIKAKEAGVDPTYIYADVNEGWKISVFIPNSENLIIILLRIQRRYWQF